MAAISAAKKQSSQVKTVLQTAPSAKTTTLKGVIVTIKRIIGGSIVILILWFTLLEGFSHFRFFYNPFAWIFLALWVAYVALRIKKNGVKKAPKMRGF